MKRTFWLAGIICVAAIEAQALPRLLNFQGRITEAGSAANGPRNIVVRVYSAPTGGSPLFTESWTGSNAVTTSSGVFNVLIGQLTPGGIPEPVFDGADRYVEVQIGAALLPRQRVVSVAHAFRAGQADGLAHGASVEFSTITASSATVRGGMTVTGTLQVGEGSIHLAAAGGGLVNAISFTQMGAQPLPQIRTAATGSQGIAAATGALPLSINTGASGNLSLNPISTGGIAIGNAATGTAGITLNAGVGPLASPSQVNLSGAVTLAGSTLTVTGQDAAGYSIRLSSGLTAPVGTVSAALFVGNGAGLTNITGTDPGKVAKAGDTMTGQLTLAASTLSVTGQDLSGFSLGLSSGINAPAGTVVAGLFVGDGSGLTNITGNDPSRVAKTGDIMTGALNMTNAGINLAGPAGNIVGQASVTASAFFGDGSSLSSLDASDMTQGTLADARLSGNIALLGSAQTFTGAKVFSAPVEFSTITASSATVHGDMKVAGTLQVGEGTIHLAAAGGGIVNAISFTQVGAQPLPQIRTAATGSQGIAAATGALPLTINTGASGNLSLNPISTGGIAIGNAATGAAGIILNAGVGPLASPSQVNLSGAVTLAGSTLTVTGQDAAGFSVRLSSGLTATLGTINAGLFVGDGSGLTNITGTDPTKVAKTGDTMTGQFTLSGSTLTVTGQDASGFSLRLSSGLTTPAGTVSAALFSGNGVALTNLTPGNISAGIAGINITGNAVTASSLSANGANCIAGSSALGVDSSGAAEGCFDVGTQNELDAKVSKAGDTLTGDLTMSNARINLTGPTGIITSASSITASSFFGDASGLTASTPTTNNHLATKGYVDSIAGPGGAGLALNSTQTWTGINTFNNAGNSFTGGTFTGGAFSGNGSNLTSLNASNVSAGTLADVRLSANVTQQGNTFNGANQLVKLDGTGKLPATDGSALTNLPVDPLMIGINVRQNSTVVDQTFEAGAFGPPKYFFISFPPAIFYPGDSRIVINTDESKTELVGFVAGTLRNLSCILESGPGVDTGLRTFTVRVNGVDTSISCTITSPVSSSGRTCTSSSSVTISAGAKISLKRVNSGASGTFPNGACYFQYAF